MELLKLLLEKHMKHEIAQIWNPSFWGTHLMKYFGFMSNNHNDKRQGCALHILNNPQSIKIKTSSWKTRTRGSLRAVVAAPTIIKCGTRTSDCNRNCSDGWS